MAYDAPIATLDALKDRLTITDVADDTVLSEMLLSVSGAMEAYAGRSLRRQHCVRERHGRGEKVLFVRHRPIAKVHWVRESLSRNFSDPDEYTELVEGVDYVLEDGTSPGESAAIRRLSGAFMGTADNPGLVEVCYTAGYKTPGELAAENGTLTISGTSNLSLMEAFSLSKRYDSVDNLKGYIPRFTTGEWFRAGVEIVSAAEDVINRGFLIFRTRGVLIPTWQITEATLAVKIYRSDGSTAIQLDVYVVPWDPKRYIASSSAIASLFSLMDADIASAAAGQLVDNQATTAVVGTPDTLTVSVHDDLYYGNVVNLSILNETLRSGFVAFAFKTQSETLNTARGVGIAGPGHSTSATRPSLVLAHRDTILDSYLMPDDLKHACLVQCASDWQIRRQPGFMQETQRGVSISSGTSYLRGEANLLPQVRAILNRYRDWV